uniref:CSON007164 protein n=1 Tax=Culicoides sonorensis TaxID=179676 RepID=A0A336LJI3_CULSO
MNQSEKSNEESIVNIEESTHGNNVTEEEMILNNLSQITFNAPSQSDENKSDVCNENLEELIKLQELNGVDLGHSLHSRQTGTKIVEFLSRTFRKKIYNYIIEQKSRISIMIDEATTVSSKAVLIVFLKCAINNESTTIFLDLI